MATNGAQNAKVRSSQIGWTATLSAAPKNSGHAMKQMTRRDSTGSVSAIAIKLTATTIVVVGLTHAGHGAPP